ncbi:hypothetical protein BC936DRAFT_149990 [Jimgerdemannia flammicorona]|uniref:Glucose-methanol-choline oxidoreductase C-terminal domain-containing protein n=1 Tax=Jimgerdemannia flammicorona TaxID=994334 RepID=A0A433DN10_9FUNG|nr:hypothetical protein BC936DRAFT_149990 [Jimgerdemannia flammicorona]
MREYFSMIAFHLNPMSRGQITLRSADPFDKPAIQPNYLDNWQDRKVLEWGFKVIKSLALMEGGRDEEEDYRWTWGVLSED